MEIIFAVIILICGFVLGSIFSKVKKTGKTIVAKDKISTAKKITAGEIVEAKDKKKLIDSYGNSWTVLSGEAYTDAVAKKTGWRVG